MNDLVTRLRAKAHELYKESQKMIPTSSDLRDIEISTVNRIIFQCDIDDYVSSRIPSEDHKIQPSFGSKNLRARYEAQAKRLGIEIPVYPREIFEVD